MSKRILLHLLVLALPLLFLFTAIGCELNQEPADRAVNEEAEDLEEDPEPREPALEEPELEEEPYPEATYYWPFVNLGDLYLSSGEFIVAPDIIESDAGFIAEFHPGHQYNGTVLWEVKDSDVFSIEWANLVFDVDYYEENIWQFTLTFEIEINNLEPEPADEGVQEFLLGISEHQRGFEITIERLLLGKEQESSFNTDPINYVALEIEMKAMKDTN